jgi:hypothetical protein
MAALASLRARLVDLQSHRVEKAFKDERTNKDERPKQKNGRRFRRPF